MTLDFMRVLLVEDEEALGQAIKQVLIGEKYVVDWVSDGMQAWNYLENQWTDYTVAVIDWLLPELSGLELCQRLRANQKPLASTNADGPGAVGESDCWVRCWRR